MKKLTTAIIVLIFSAAVIVHAQSARLIPQSLPAVKITDSIIFRALNDSIVPVAVKNGYDKYENQIILTLYNSDKWYSVWPVKYYADIEALYLKTVNITELKNEDRYKAASFYGIDIDGVPVVVIDMTNGEGTRETPGNVTVYHNQKKEANEQKSNYYRYSISDRGTFLESYRIGGCRYLDGYYPTFKGRE